MKFFKISSQVAFLVLFLWPIFGQGQYNIEWGEENVTSKLYPFVDMVEYGENIYVVCSDFNGITGAVNANIRIEKKSKNLKLEKKINLNLRFNGKKFAFLKFVKFNDKLFFLAHAWNRKGGYRMILSSFDTKMLRPGKEQFEFYTLVDSPIMCTTNKKEGEEEQLIVVEEKFIRGTLKLELTTYILDANLNPSFEHTSKIRLEKANDFKLKKIQMDANQYIYFVGIERPAVLKVIGHPVSKERAFVGHLFRIDTKNKKDKHVVIKMENGEFLRDINLLQDDKYLTIIGLYSNRKLKKNIAPSVKGIFTKQSTLDNFTDFKTKHHPISKKFAHYSLKVKEKKRLNKHGVTKEMYSLTLKDVSFWGGNQILIVTEVVSGSFKDPFHQGSVFLTADMIVLTCDQRGNLIWMNNIHKKAIERGTSLERGINTSYFMYIEDEKVNFLYKGTRRNIEVSGKKLENINTTEARNNQEILHTQMNYTDGVKTTNLLSLKRRYGKPAKIVSPAFFLLLKNNDYLLYGKVNNLWKKGRLGILHFD